MTDGVKDKMVTRKPASGNQRTVFQVEGITCLDCARKFEQAVGAMPGVISVSLNAMTGRLMLEGQSDLEKMRRLGQEEN